MLACSFSRGCFEMMHPNGRGKQRVWFDDGEHFGPSYVNMRTGELSPISDKHPWFWFAYDDWRSGGRLTDPTRVVNTPNGPLQRCVIPSDKPQERAA